MTQPTLSRVEAVRRFSRFYSPASACWRKRSCSAPSALAEGQFADPCHNLAQVRLVVDVRSLELNENS